MEELKDGSVQTIMTSPPYFNQRNYGYDEQIGLEENIADTYFYVFDNIPDGNLNVLDIVVLIDIILEN